VPKHGAAVVPVAPEEARDVLDARAAVELAAAERLLRDDQSPTAAAAMADLVDTGSATFSTASATTLVTPSARTRRSSRYLAGTGARHLAVPAASDA
jgi:DNA-binding GntR family transcriptional regulator